MILGFQIDLNTALHVSLEPPAPAKDKKGDRRKSKIPPKISVTSSTPLDVHEDAKEGTPAKAKNQGGAKRAIEESKK